MTYRRNFLSAVFGASLLLSPAAMAEALNERVQDTIQSQMTAFMADDAATAYGFAAPSIQSYFGSPGRFMDMVRSGYLPVYRPSNVRFGKFAERDGQLLQEVRLTGPKGQDWVALYTLQAQDDGSLRITGCQLIKDVGVGI